MVPLFRPTPNLVVFWKVFHNILTNCSDDIIPKFLQIIQYTIISMLNWFTVDVHKVLLIPNVSLLTIREGTQKEVLCVVNSDAVPAPTITWYMESSNITIMAKKYTTSITVSGNRTDNTKKLECRATNSNKPPRTASLTLNVECKNNDSLYE